MKIDTDKFQYITNEERYYSVGDNCGVPTPIAH